MVRFILCVKRGKSSGRPQPLAMSDWRSEPDIARGEYDPETQKMHCIEQADEARNRAENLVATSFVLKRPNATNAFINGTNYHFFTDAHPIDLDQIERCGVMICSYFLLGVYQCLDEDGTQGVLRM